MVYELQMSLGLKGWAILRQLDAEGFKQERLGLAVRMNRRKIKESSATGILPHHQQHP